VNRLAAWHLPRGIGAGLVLAAMVGTLVFAVEGLRDDAAALIESLPQAAEKVRRAVQRERTGSGNALDKVQQAAVQLQKATQEGAPPPPPPERGVTRVQIEPNHVDLKTVVWANTPRVLSGLGEATVVVLMAYFVLAGGHNFRRKLVTLAGPSFARRKLTVQGLDEITEQIQRYLLVQVAVSVIVGVATWLLYLAIGLQHAAVWGAAAFVLNFVPYLGSIVVTVGASFAAFVQFGGAEMVLLVASTTTTLHLVTGYILTPWLTSRTSRLSALSVFVAVIAFGWLWGVWGLLLGVPTLMMIKSVCDRVDGLQPIGELLGR
jgi:predicted PurR-regulated permease PerM